MVKNSERRPVAVMIISYLLVATAIGRGIYDYPGEILPLLIVAVGYGLTLIAQRLIRARLSDSGRVPALSLVVMAVQVGSMVAAFFIAPYSDTWSLLLLPACIMAMNDFSRRIGWMIIGVFTVAMSVMILYGHGWPWGLNFIVLYLAAYSLVGAYSLSLKRARSEERRSARLLDQLTVAHAKLRAHADSVAELTSMKERNRIARDLHDSVTQTIFSMTLITQSVLILTDREPDKVPGKLEQLAELSQTALGEMRKLITEMRGGDGESGSLGEEINRHIDEVTGSSDLQTRFVAPEDLPTVAPDSLRHLSNIAREALNNVVKHSGATEVSVTLSGSGQGVVLTVTDNGRGFDPDEKRDPTRQIGLPGMAERAAEIGATLTVNSSAAAGTTIVVDAPLVWPAETKTEEQ